VLIKNREIDYKHVSEKRGKTVRVLIKFREVMIKNARLLSIIGLQGVLNLKLAV